MGNPEAGNKNLESKNTVKETADKNKINKAPAPEVAKQLNKTVKLPTEADKKPEVWKETDLVKDKFPDFKYDNIKTIMVQYHLLGWNREAGGAQGFDTLALKDLYKLPTTTKANLAYLSSMLNFGANGKQDTIIDTISKTDYMVQNQFDSKTITQKLSRILAGDRLTPTDLQFAKAFRTSLEQIKHTEILSKYTNMFPAGEEVPPMPDIQQYAVGDGGSTMGIGGDRNGGRRLFEYGETGLLSTNSKHVQYGVDASKPMNISVLPSGADAQRNNTITLVINDANGKSLGKITGRYSAAATANNMSWSKKGLEDIIIENNTIKIPASYQNTKMALIANADYVGSGRHDEANFSLSIENGRTISPNDIKVGEVSSYLNEKITNPMELGKFELTEQTKTTINQIMDKSLFFGNKTMKDHIKMNLTIGVDQTKFNTAGMENTLRNYDKYILANKNILVNQLKVFTNEQWTSMLNKLDPNWENDPIQYKAQKKLLACRFITTVNQMIQNKEMANAIKSGKFDIAASCASDGKYISLQPDAMNYVKPATVVK